jgi:UDP-N-acetylglucosamine 2-epimerase
MKQALELDVGRAALAARNVFGDGRASERISKVLEERFS